MEIEVDTEELALFIACCMSQQEIDKEGLKEVVHSRRFKAGARPGLTCKAITSGPASRQADRSWVAPVRAPDRAEKMRMVGCLIRAACRLVMTNHFYTFDNVIRRQARGGAIGNKLTERLGKLLMKRHDQVEFFSAPTGFLCRGPIQDLHCSHIEWGHKIFLMETQLGSNFV